MLVIPVARFFSPRQLAAVKAKFQLFLRLPLAFLQIRQRLQRRVDIRRHHFFLLLRVLCRRQLLQKLLEPLKQRQPFLHDPPMIIENAEPILLRPCHDEPPPKVCNTATKLLPASRAWHVFLLVFTKAAPRQVDKGREQSERLRSSSPLGIRGRAGIIEKQKNESQVLFNQGPGLKEMQMNGRKK